MGIMNDAGEAREREMGLRILALKRYARLLEEVADMAEVNAECLDRGLDLKELRKEAGL